MVNLREQEDLLIRKKIIQLIGKEQYEEAKVLLVDGSKHVSRWSPEELTAFYQPQLAYVYFKLNDHYKCRKILNTILEEHPRHGSSSFLMAYLDLLENNKSKAIYRYSELLKLADFQKKSKRILNAIAKSNSLTGLLLKKTPSFFYQHPSQLLPPKITSPREWFRFQQSLFRFNRPSPQNQTAPSKNKRLKKSLLTTILVLALLSIGVIVLRYWKTNDSSPIEKAVQEGTTYGQLYQRIENAIKVRDMNNAIISYNQATQKGIPLKLQPYFDFLIGFVVTPDTESLPITRSFTHLKKEPMLYLNTFVRLHGKLRPHRSQRFLFISSRSKGEVQISFNTAPVVDPSKQYEIISLFKGIVDRKIFLEGISIRLMITN